MSTTFLIKKIQVWRTIFLEPDFSNQVSQTRFLKPLFYTFPEKWLQIKWSTGLSDNVWKIVLNFLLYDVNLANWRHRPLYLTLFKFSSALIWTTKEYLDPLCHWVNTTARISPPQKKIEQYCTYIYVSLNPHWHELRQKEKCSSLDPLRGIICKTQEARQGVKLTGLMSIFTTKKFLIRI